jgi:hypothetical protein
MALPWHFGWAEEARHRVSSRPPAPHPAATPSLQPTTVAATTVTRSPDAAPVVNYRIAVVRIGLLESADGGFTLRSSSMPQTPILVPTRRRCPPKTGWSWVDRRFLREHAAHLSRDAVLLYFFLCAVANKHGLSFYADSTVAVLLGMTLPALISARSELLTRDLIAHETRWTQVLSLAPVQPRRSSGPGQGPVPLGEILRHAFESTRSHPEGGLQ